FSYYNGAEEFRGFLYAAFIGSGTGITVAVTDESAEITADGKDVLINTFTDENDEALYSAYGYHLIVDSRKVASVYDDFYAYCKSVNGGQEISYGEYLQLSDNEKTNYRFAVRYSGKQKVFGEQDIDEYTAYFGSLPEGDAKNEYKALVDKKQEISVEEFNDALYVLYVKNYYPDMLNVVGESVPTLRNYYYGLTRRSQDKYLCLFGDMLTAAFGSYNGNVLTYGGVYRQGQGLDIAGLNEEQARAEVDGFVKDVYYSGLSTALVLETLNCLFQIVIVEFIIVGCMLLCFALGKLKKTEFCNTFGRSAKAVASYAHIAAFFSALAAFCIGFAFSGAAVSIAAYVVFATVLIVRTLILVLFDKNKTERVSE
ncbi:MAG: hypothetical protein K2I29_04830, partial [Clostridia bacterium]|nr:hypothetical protein [Clostridia bacterium]